MTGRARILAGGIGVYALAVRIWVLLDRLDLGTFRLFVDSELYRERAARILGGAFVPDAAFFMSPGYSYFLSIFPGAGQPNLLLAGLAQAVLGVAGLFGLAYFAGKSAGPVACMATLALGAVAGPLVLYDTSILPDGPTLACIGIGLGLLAMAEAAATSAGRLRRYAGAGLAFALAIALRSNIALTGLFLGLMILVRRNRSERPVFPWKNALAFVAPILLAAAGITVLNGIAEGIWSPASQNSGINLYIGNNAASTGLYTDLDGRIASLEDPKGRSEPEQVLGPGLDSRQVNRYWFRLALNRIRSEPAATLSLWFRKFLLVWTHREIPQMEHYRLARMESAGYRFAPFGFVFIFALATAGTPVLLRRENRYRAGVLVIVLLTGAATCTVFFVNGRLRLPIWAALLPMAGCGVASLVHSSLRREWRKIAGGLFSAGAAVLFSFLIQVPLAAKTSPEYSALRYALVELQAGNLEPARRWAEREQAWRNGTEPSPKVLLERAAVQAKLGDYRGAFRSLVEAADRLPENLQAQQGLLAVCHKLEQRGEADRSVRAAASRARRRLREANER